MEDNKIFGRRLRSLLNDTQVTQEELAAFLDITQGTISKYLSGERKPDILALKQIAEYFGTTTDYLIGNTDIRNVDALAETVIKELKDAGIIDDLGKASKQDLEKVSQLLKVVTSGIKTINGFKK